MGGPVVHQKQAEGSLIYVSLFLLQDKDVDHQDSLPLLYSLGTEDVQLTYLKHAGHTLTDDQSLEVIYDAILRLASEVDKKARL